MYNHTTTKQRNSMKTLKVSEEVWRKLKQLALDNDSTIGKEIERLVDGSK